MATSSIPLDDFGYDEGIHDNYGDVDYITTPRTSKHGTYNIVPKDYGDHKVNVYIPRENMDDYGITQLEDMSLIDEQQIREPSVARRRIYQQRDSFDHNNGFEYLEEAPYATPRTIVSVSPARQRETQVITEIYEPQPPPVETIEYVYETEPIPEETEYIIEEHIRQPIYVEAPRPVRRSVIIQEPVIVAAPPPPPPPPPPVSRSPRRKLILPRTPSPEIVETARRKVIFPQSPAPDPSKSPRRSLRFTNSSTMDSVQTTTRRRTQQRTTRSPPLPAPPPPPPPPPVKKNIHQSDELPPSLMEIVAQNRARRGTRVRRPRREIYEDNVHDLPTYHKNIIKNGFMVHK